MNSKALVCLCLWQLVVGILMKFDIFRSTWIRATGFTL